MLLVPFEEKDIKYLQSSITDAASCLLWGGNSFSFPLKPDEIKNKIIDDVNVTAFIACEESLPVGYFDFVKLDEYVYKICRILIFGTLKGKGLGRKMLSAALELAGEQLNASEVVLNVLEENSAALNLYLSFGFEIVKTESRLKDESGNPRRSFYMRKILSTA